MNVIDYCKEEVSRQGHDVDALDGIRRVGWMLDAWEFAIKHSHHKPEPHTIRRLGIAVERDENYGGWRAVDVWVGTHGTPPPGEVLGRINILCEANGRGGIKPLDFYREFELIHPFVDGNGRVGKILLNWVNGTLLDPIFPPDDFWGRPIRNP